MRLSRMTALASVAVALLACDSAAIEQRDSGEAEAGAGALDLGSGEADASLDARAIDGSEDGEDARLPDAGSTLDADLGDDAGPLDGGETDAAVCTMGESRNCGGEGVFVGDASRCVVGYQTCRGGCSDTCPFAMDDTCDDNRPGAGGGCEYGTDCTDCGSAALEWSGCIESIAPIDEVCDNMVDDDCDGMTDEDVCD